MARKPTDMVQLKLRFSEALRRKMEKAAVEADRSMNSEIIQRLERSFEQQGLLREVLEILYGPARAQIFTEAHAHGILSLPSADKEIAKAAFSRIIDAIPTKEPKS